MMPENRLTNLIAQAIDHQISHCLYHNPTNIIIPASSDGSGHAVVSLLSDHKCERSDFPIRTSHILEHRKLGWRGVNIRWRCLSLYLHSPSLRPLKTRTKYGS